MTNFEKIKSMTEDELADWLSKNGDMDEAVWNKWFNENYCQECETVEAYVPAFDRVCDHAFCEINKFCKFFEDNDIMDPKMVIKLWLEREA